MKKYIGIKLVKAESMILAEAVNKGFYKSFGLLSPSTPGYHVITDSGGNSWVPKDTFESSYFGIDGDDSVTTRDVFSFPGIKNVEIDKTSPTIMDHLKFCLWFAYNWGKNGLKKISGK